MEFRKDINGLRAIAVLAVLFFHFNENWLSGGFAGVDVFFVISGFLMTGIIVKRVEQNTFSLLQYYTARANRIIPALAFLCLTLLVLGWFYLTPDDYQRLGKHIGSSLGFISNFVYWSEFGYFDAAAKGKWLLHTWSLSAEWQFYMLYPLLIMLLLKFMPLNKAKLALVFLTLIGFIYSVFATPLLPNESYYLLPARAWEMLLGGLAYLYPWKLQENKKRAVEYLGLLLILISFVFFSKQYAWPGHLALFPVLGAYLIIQAQRQQSLLTSNIIFQYLGKWSYSIYLWHWPVVVAIYYYSLNEHIIYVFVSLFLGFLSHRYIESIQFKKKVNTLFAFLTLKPLLLVIFLGGLSSLVFLSNGASWHYSDEVLKHSQDASARNPYHCVKNNSIACYIGNQDNIKAIIVGDSHASALTSALAASFDLNNEGMISLNQNACPFILGIKSVVSGEYCKKQNERRLSFLTQNYQSTPVFWIARSSVYILGQSNPDKIYDQRDTKPYIYFSQYYAKLNQTLLDEIEMALRKTFNEIKQQRHVFLVLPTPEMRTNVPNKIMKFQLLNKERNPVQIEKSQYLARNKEMLTIFDKLSFEGKVSLLDPSLYLCDENYCYGEQQGRALYFDGDHLSEYGNKLLTPMFKQALN